MYDRFISGNGVKILKDLFTDSGRVQGIVRSVPENVQPMDIIVERYTAIINSKNLPHDRANYHTKEAGEYFYKVLPLIDSVDKIDSPKELPAEPTE